MSELVFLKLGGSLITDKTSPETPRPAVLKRLAQEIRGALDARSDLQLVLGHGSGSFGHVVAANYSTRQGVQTALQWRGFAEVGAAAARLNGLVRKSLLAAGVPVITLQPSASARCRDGRIFTMAIEALYSSLEAGLVPLVYGDVAFDEIRGGTIISTEEILSYVAENLEPRRFLLAGETPGVLDSDGQVISTIVPETLADVKKALGRSRGVDVTGGMLSKVLGMMSLVETFPDMTIQIFSGLESGAVERALIGPAPMTGTRLMAQQGPDIQVESAA